MNIFASGNISIIARKNAPPWSAKDSMFCINCEVQSHIHLVKKQVTTSLVKI